jgi:hypothetical protein
MQHGQATRQPVPSPIQDQYKTNTSTTPTLASHSQQKGSHMYCAPWYLNSVTISCAQSIHYFLCIRHMALFQLNSTGLYDITTNIGMLCQPESSPSNLTEYNCSTWFIDWSCNPAKELWWLPMPIPMPYFLWLAFWLTDRKCLWLHVFQPPESPNQSFEVRSQRHSLATHARRYILHSNVP